MKPSRLQYFFGHGLKVSTSVGAIALTAVVVISIGNISIWTVIAVLPALPLGWILGALILWPMVFTIGSRFNGAPFNDGDMVHVLVGPYRDQVGRVYEMWPSRNQLRVDLGEQAEQDVTDVFVYNEVCRERDA